MSTSLTTFLTKYKSFILKEGFIETVNVQSKVRYKRNDSKGTLVVTIEDIKNTNLIKVMTLLPNGFHYITNIQEDDPSNIFERLLLSYHDSESHIKDTEREISE